MTESLFIPMEDGLALVCCVGGGEDHEVLCLVGAAGIPCKHLPCASSVSHEHKSLLCSSELEHNQVMSC